MNDFQDMIGQVRYKIVKKWSLNEYRFNNVLWYVLRGIYYDKIIFALRWMCLISYEIWSFSYNGV